MTLVGNPQDYIMMFGGSTYEAMPNDSSIKRIKKTLDDLWVYYIGKNLW